jgi:hypothetical protein
VTLVVLHVRVRVRAPQRCVIQLTGFLWDESTCELQEDFKQLADAFGESPQCTPDQLFSCLTGFMDAYEVHFSCTLAAPIDYQ